MTLLTKHATADSQLPVWGLSSLWITSAYFLLHRHWHTRSMILSMFTLCCFQGRHWLTYRKIWSNSTFPFSTLQLVWCGGGEGGSNNHGIIDGAAIVLGLLKIFVLQCICFTMSTVCQLSECNSQSICDKVWCHIYIKLNSVALVRERTIPTERPPPVGEVSANFCG